MHRESDDAVLRALLIEGSGVARDMLQRVLRGSLMQAVDVVAVTAPQDAPAGLAAFDLLLLDVDWDANGAGTLLARMPATCWRLATTLYDDEERLLPMIEIGIHGYLLKQDRYERQVEVLQRIVRGRADLSPALARVLWERLRDDPRLSEELGQALSSYGRGLSLKEIARGLRRTLAEVEALMASVYALGRRTMPAAAPPQRRTGGYASQ